MDWATFWAIFSQTHLVTLLLGDTNPAWRGQLIEPHLSEEFIRIE
jgi:hypothetical protein